MAGPWEKYQNAPQPGPWERYQPSGPSVGEVAAEVPRAAGRGVMGSLEFLGDVGDIAPPGQLVGALQEAALTERTLPETLQAMPIAQAPARATEAWQARRAQGAGVLPAAWSAATAGLEQAFTGESSGDRLRQAAAAAAAPLTERRLPENQDPLVEGLLTGTEFAAGSMVGPGGPLNLVRQAAKAGVGAGGGRVLAETLGLGEGGTMASEITGAILATITGPRNAMQKGARKVRALLSEAEDIPIAVREQALADLKQAVEAGGDELPETLARIRSNLDRGDVGSLGRVSESPGLASVESTIPGGASIGGAKEELQAMARAADVQVRQRLLAPMEGFPGRADAGEGVMTAVESARKTAKEAERAAWSAVPRDELVLTSGIKQKVQEILETATPAMRRRFQSTFATELKDIDDLGTVATGEELSDLRSLVAQAYKEAGEATTDDRFVAQVSDAIKQTLDNSAGGEAFQAARAASRKYHEAFTEGPLARARAAASRAGTPETMGVAVSPTGPKGRSLGRAAAAADEVAGGTAVRDAVGNAMRSEFRQAVTSGADEFNLSRARNWLKQRADALGEQPAVKAELEALRDMAEAAETTAAKAPGAVDKLQGPEAQRWVTGLARLVGAKVGGTISGQPLIAANLSSAQVKRMLEEQPRKAYTRLIRDYMLEPEKYLADMERLGENLPEDEVVNVLQSMFNRAGVGVAAGAQATQE